MAVFLWVSALQLLCVAFPAWSQREEHLEKLIAARLR
jgi:hypothetical protein